MRRLSAILLIVCILSTVLLCACGDQPAVDGAMTAVKDENGNITGYERRYHNDNGDITRWDVYDAQEQYLNYTLYEYDSSGNLAKETLYEASGIGIHYYAYSYTDEGVLAEMDYASAKDGSSRTLYDEEGIEKERYTYNNKDRLVKFEEYVFGEWVERDLPTESSETTEESAE
ncbi:MAG: hypothetical protein IJH40_00365 [Ruminococcus sp.]|uniref:hypothetical protein n=1 Tax=Ruminococcus sp. TaxID=41978 RepID=UPI002872FAAC|nr:hypothetical protein [Ruminococcus sp.]MBQ3284076.1 hypothetical protein [Ruminococcus sp.]